MPRLLLLFVCCISVPFVASSCTLPPELVLDGNFNRLELQVREDNEFIIHECPAMTYLQYDVGGPMMLIRGEPTLKCDKQTNTLGFFNFHVDDDGEHEDSLPMPVTFGCGFPKDNAPDMGWYNVNLKTADGSTVDVVVRGGGWGERTTACPPNQVMQRNAMERRLSLYLEYLLRRQLLQQRQLSRLTTTTKAPTTTVKKDTNPTAAQLWNVNYYYNYGVGVHAFCADQTCINAIQKNGIGYDMTNGKGVVGRAVTESAIAAVRAACPTGSKNLRNLGFTKSGNKYLHNLSGTGLKQGWVSIVSGSCGAVRQIKRWKSRYTDDMMYDVNLEWNTWYQGMVQDGGKVQFYMWN